MRPDNGIGARVFLRYTEYAYLPYAELMADVTTIKVPKALRDRIAASAADAGLTAQAFLQSLLEIHERNKRLAAVADAYRASSEEDLDSWREETADWAAIGTDGLGR